MNLEINIGSILKTLWNFAYGLFQFSIDHKHDLTYAILFPLIFIAIFLIVYCEIENRNFLNIIKTPAFFVPNLFLILAILSVLLLTGKESNPPDDGKLYITIEKMGRTDTANELHNFIEFELKKWAPFTTNLIIHRGKLLETIRNEKSARKFGSRHGVHLILYGTLKKISEKEKKWIIQYEILQIKPYKDQPLLSKIAFSEYFNADDPKDLKRIAKDLTLNVIKRYETHQFLTKQGRAHIRCAMLSVFPPATMFNFGSNLLMGLDIGKIKDNEAFLSLKMERNGNFFVSGRLYDSDGNNSIEIRDNKEAQPDQNKFFTIRRMGQFFSIQDSYDRIVLQVTENNDPKGYLRSLSKYYEENHMSPVSEEYIEYINKLESKIMVIGEIYGKDGNPLAIIEPFEMIIYTDDFRLPLDLVNPYGTTRSLNSKKTAARTQKNRTLADKAKESSLPTKTYKPGTYVFVLEAGKSTDHWIHQPNRTTCSFFSNNGQFEVHYRGGKIVKAWVGDKHPNNDPIFKLYAKENTFIKIEIIKLKKGYGALRK